MTVIEERNMAGKAITNTYKGILRISNNIDLIEGEYDSFLNGEYYLPANSNAWSGNGVQQTHDFLSENSSIKRFRSSDSYLNLKLPVTDSAGNYLSFSLGADSSLVGSNCKYGIVRAASEQFSSADTDTFASLESLNYIILGRKKQPEKGIYGLNLNIDSSDTSNAKLVVLNTKRHSDNIIAPVGDGEKIRTIYDVAKATPQKYDILLHEQEDYEKNGAYKDCKVKLENLKEYVYKQVGRYLQANATSVPTGTIISQYCNLDKWYCWDKDVENINDLDKWQGYRPAMTNSTYAPYSYYNVVQGKFLKTKTYLYFNDDRGSLNAFTSEMPPDFKRGYALCDGGALSIYLSPFWDQSAIGEKKSLEILLDLFHNIGYYYHKDNENPPIHNCVLANGKYSYEENSNYWKDSFKTDRDVCYGISLSTILAFKELDNRFSLKAEPFSGNTAAEKLTNCLNWLAGQSIPEEYIFNIMVPSSLESSNYKNSYYRYTDSAGNVKNYINIGRQISTFNDEIPYYKYNNGQYTLTTCKIVDTAEVRDIAMLFINKTSNQNNWSRYYYTFYLPKLYTTTDPDVNEAYKYLINDGKDREIAIGQFIGSNGTLIADSIIVPHTNQTITPGEKFNTYTCLYRHSYGYNAHNHALAMGRTSFGSNDYGYFEPDATEIDNNGSRISSLTAPAKKSYNKLSSSTISNTNVVASDYHRSFSPTVNKTLLSTYLMDNYIFQDVPDTISEENITYSLGTGSVGYEILNSDSNNFKWYGRSSEPLWTSHDITAKTIKYDECVGYFTPESIKVMPLIKL